MIAVSELWTILPANTINLIRPVIDILKDLGVHSSKQQSLCHAPRQNVLPEPQISQTLLVR
jgi:hypothetical protein